MNGGAATQRAVRLQGRQRCVTLNLTRRAPLRSATALAGHDFGGVNATGAGASLDVSNGKTQELEAVGWTRNVRQCRSP
jgi:hypothetical protein